MVFMVMFIVTRCVLTVAWAMWIMTRWIVTMVVITAAQKDG